MLKDDRGVSISFLCVNDQVLKLKADKKNSIKSSNSLYVIRNVILSYIINIAERIWTSQCIISFN